MVCGLVLSLQDAGWELEEMCQCFPVWLLGFSDICLRGLR